MKRLVRWAVGLAAVALFATAVLALYQAMIWPDVARLADSEPLTTAFIERARSRGVDVRWQWVAYDDISVSLKRAVIAAEDISFFSHRGFDTEEMAIAAREAIEGKRLRGASTITQQLAKNLWLSPSRSPLRKLKEVVLTRQLERNLSKRRILEIYLNVVEFGPGLYGAEAAARHYFGMSAAELDNGRAAQLAAALPRPSTWHPGSQQSGYERHVDRILGRMDQAEWLDRFL